MHCSASEVKEGQINHCSCTNTIPFSLSEILDQNPEIQRNHMNISWTHEHKSSNQHKLTQIRNHSSPIPRFASVSTNQKHIQIIIQPQVFFVFQPTSNTRPKIRTRKEKSNVAVVVDWKEQQLVFFFQQIQNVKNKEVRRCFLSLSFFVDLGIFVVILK